MTGTDRVRLLYGGLLLVTSGRLGPRVVGRPLDRSERVAACLLGARHVVQASTRLRGPELDVVHAVSMAGLACISRHHRRIALISAALAASWAVVDQ